MKKHLSILFSTGFYVGYVPFAPGTFGTLVGLLLFAIVNLVRIELQLVLFFICFLIAIPTTREAIKKFGNSDPPQVIIDEILGVWIALILFETSFKNLLWGFVFFRLFDIVKPFPVGLIDKKLKGEIGVLLDDIAAGLMAKGAIWLLFHIK